MTMWTLWAATECEGLALCAMQNGPSVKTRDAALYETTVTALRPKFAVLDAALSDGKGSLVGNRFTAADLNVAEIVPYARAAPELFAGSLDVRSWIAACQSPLAYKAMMTERNAEPV
jgi:glutathione S-transferase